MKATAGAQRTYCSRSLPPIHSARSMASATRKDAGGSAYEPVTSSRPSTSNYALHPPTLRYPLSPLSSLPRALHLNQ